MLDDNTINSMYNKCKNLVTKKDYKNAREAIKELIDAVEPLYISPLKKYYSFNHILDSYYYSYFFKDTEELNYAMHNINDYYRLYGFIFMHLERYDEASVAYNKALLYNPVDVDTYFQLGELYKKTGNIRGVKKISFEVYNYCCSRATMAHFYRNLGYYYLENYKPETALALYIYSNIFYETKQALSEIDFLKSTVPSLNDTHIFSLKKDIKKLQSILEENNIPTGPNPDTIGITYRVGQLEMQALNYENACDCFTLVYDLTLDKDVEKDLICCKEHLQQN